MRYITIIAFIFSVIFSNEAFAQNNVGTNWERGVHVLGSAIFDIGQAKFQYGYYAGRITDCSDDEFYCLSNGTADFVLPKVCQNHTIGTEWKLNNVRTSIIGQLEEPQGHLTVPNKKISIVVSRSTPRFAYMYGGRTGIVGMIFNPNDNVSFDGLVRSGELIDTVQILMRGNRVGNFVYLPLITHDQFAPCDPTAVLEPDNNH